MIRGPEQKLRPQERKGKQNTQNLSKKVIGHMQHQAKEMGSNHHSQRKETDEAIANQYLSSVFLKYYAEILRFNIYKN